MYNLFWNDIMVRRMLKTTLSKDGVKGDVNVEPKAIKDMTEHHAKRIS